MTALDAPCRRSHSAPTMNTMAAGACNTALSRSMASSVVVVRLQDVRHNYRVFLKNAAGSVAAVIKNNAYGLGAVEVYRALKSEGCCLFFVAYAHEALHLINHGAKGSELAVFNGLWPDTVDFFFTQGAIPVLSSMHDILVCYGEAKRRGVAITVMIQVETGLNRLGISQEEWTALRGHDDIFEWLRVRTLLTQLACGYRAHDYNTEQVDQIFAFNIDDHPALCSVEYSWCATGGSMHSRLTSIASNKGHYNTLMRLGRGLYYGSLDYLEPALASHPLAQGLRVPLSFFGRVLDVRYTGERAHVGYDQKFYTEKPRTLGVIAVGYADGYAAYTSHDAYVYWHGFMAPVIESSMDLLLVDLTNAPFASEVLRSHIGSYIELLGEHVRLYHWCAWMGQKDFEMLSHLGKRSDWVYVDDDNHMCNKARHDNRI